MKAMIFAAGEGRRMRPLTLTTPKPLLPVGDYSLLEHLIRRLQAAGISDLVINVSYLAEQVIAALERIDLNGMACQVSVEERPLETGGGLKRALPYLGDAPFLLVNSDVWFDIDYRNVVNEGLPASALAHLLLVASPQHNQSGDFVINQRGQVHVKSDTDQPADCLTFSGVSVIHPELVHRYSDEREVFPLRDLLHGAIIDKRVTGEYATAYWSDVGTPERLEDVRARYLSSD